jgi:HSP20 family protein
MINRNNPGNALMRRSPGAMTRESNLPMLITDPLREMEEMRHRMDSLFSTFFNLGMPGSQMRRQDSEAAGVEPDVDVFENDSEFIIHAALPGIKPEDIRVEATGDTIMLTAESKSPFENDNGDGRENPQNQQNQQGAQGTPGTQAPHTQHRQSRYFSQRRFEFAYTLPEEIKPNEARAVFNHGRLELHLPKMENRAITGQPISIPITAASQAGQGTQGSSTGKPTQGQMNANTGNKPVNLESGDKKQEGDSTKDGKQDERRKTAKAA